MPGQRIASLLSAGTEMLCALGLRSRLVGISHECDFPAKIVGLPRLTYTNVDPAASSLAIDQQVRQLMERGEPLYAIDLPRLVELAPDLIVTQAQCDVCAVRYDDVVAAVAHTPALQGTQIVALNPQQLSDVIRELTQLGQAAGVEQRAVEVARQWQERIDRVARRTRELLPHQRPRVACIEWLEPLMLSGNWVPQLVQLAGGEPGLTVSGQHSPYVGWEQLRAWDPEAVVVMPCGFDLPRTVAEAPLLARLPGWHKLAAVRQRRVWAVDGNAYFNRSGPRLIDSLELMARLLHPERFADQPAPPAHCQQVLDTLL